MKKICIVLLAMLLMLTVGCKKAEPEEEVLMDAPLSGGWTPTADCEVTEERKAILEKGLAGLVGVDYEPIAYLGSQVVAGTNHVFLCKATVVYPDARPTYALVYLYEDLQGDVQLMNVADMPLVPQEDGTAIAPEEGLMGGWSYAENPAVTEEILTRFSQTLAGKTGVSYAPVANLGTQVAAGLNRCLLCEVSAPQPHYALVYVYEKLDGEAEIFQVIDLDVGALCTYGA